MIPQCAETQSLEAIASKSDQDPGSNGVVMEPESASPLPRANGTQPPADPQPAALVPASKDNAIGGAVEAIIVDHAPIESRPMEIISVLQKESLSLEAGSVSASSSSTASSEESVHEMGNGVDDDELPDVSIPEKVKNDDGGELPDIVETEASVAPSPLAPIFTRPSLESPQATKKPKAPRGGKKGAGGKTAAAPKPKLPVVPETTEMASLGRKLSALQKEDLIDIIKRSVYFGKAPSLASLENDMPKPNVKEFAKEIRRLKSAIMKAVPRNFYGSNRDHYSFLRCQAALNEFTKVASEQISVLSKLEVSILWSCKN